MKIDETKDTMNEIRDDGSPLKRNCCRQGNNSF